MECGFGVFPDRYAPRNPSCSVVPNCSARTGVMTEQFSSMEHNAFSINEERPISSKRTCSRGRRTAGDGTRGRPGGRQRRGVPTAGPLAKMARTKANTATPNSCRIASAENTVTVSFPPSKHQQALSRPSRAYHNNADTSGSGGDRSADGARAPRSGDREAATPRTPAPTDESIYSASAGKRSCTGSGASPRTRCRNTGHESGIPTCPAKNRATSHIIELRAARRAFRGRSEETTRGRFPQTYCQDSRARRTWTRCLI